MSNCWLFDRLFPALSTKTLDFMGKGRYNQGMETESPSRAKEHQPMLTHQESRMIQEVIERREEARRRPDTAYRVEIEHPVCDWGVCRIPADGETPPRHRAAVAASCYFADRAPKDEHGRVDGMPSRTRVIFECEGEDGAWLFEKTSETGMVSYRLDELRFTP